MQVELPFTYQELKVFNHLLKLLGLRHYTWSQLNKIYDDLEYRTQNEPCSDKFVFNDFSRFCKECGFTVYEHNPEEFERQWNYLFTIPENFLATLKKKKSVLTKIKEFIHAL